MRSHLRLAILECDTPLTHTRAQYGSYGGVFSALLHAGAEALGVPGDRLRITRYDVVERGEYPELADVDALLITGSRFSAFDGTGWIVRLVEF
ncbi:MAG: hypothetical protein LQ347_003001, partial [Umbilicaria vellea]